MNKNKKTYWLVMCEDGFIEIHFTREDARNSKRLWGRVYPDMLGNKLDRLSYKIKKIEVEF